MFVDATKSKHQSVEARREDQDRACQIAEMNMLRVVQAITITRQGGTPDLALAVRSNHAWRQLRSVALLEGIQGQAFLLTLNRETVASVDDGCVGPSRPTKLASFWIPRARRKRDMV